MEGITAIIRRLSLEMCTPGSKKTPTKKPFDSSIENPVHLTCNWAVPSHSPKHFSPVLYPCHDLILILQENCLDPYIPVSCQSCLGKLSLAKLGSSAPSVACIIKHLFFKNARDAAFWEILDLFRRTGCFVLYIWLSRSKKKWCLFIHNKYRTWKCSCTTWLTVS